MKVGMIALTAALLLLAGPALAGKPFSCTGGDSDTDTIGNGCDNCTDVPNPAGLGCDSDDDGYGNSCDGDFNNDNTVNAIDFGSDFFPDFIAGSDADGDGTDMNCDTVVNALDFALFFAQFGASVPGDSGLNCAGQAGCGVNAGN
jgi:hypothetical protein